MAIPQPARHLTTTTTPAGATATTTFSQDLEGLLVYAKGRAITLKELVEVMGERGHATAMIVLALPFLLPVPTMGLSAPAGFAIAVLGLCLALRVRPWLPGFLARRVVPADTLTRAVAAATHASQGLEKVLKPRLGVVLWPVPHALMGLAIFGAGIALGLPIPLPFANAVPALAILLFATGLVERDGAFVLAGHAVWLATVALGIVLWEVVLAAAKPLLPFVLD